MSSPIVTVCFARVKSSTAGSVSLSDWLGCLRGFVKRISQGGMTEHPKNEEPFGLSLPLCLQSKLPRIAYTPMLEQHPLQDGNFFGLHGMAPFPV
jgi:hypothetical protein